MFNDDPKHCALGIYSVLGSLWEARNALNAMRPEGITGDDGAQGSGWWWDSKNGRRYLKRAAKGAARADESESDNNGPNSRRTIA